MLGGYAVAACWAAALARTLPGSRADATLTATMLSFVIYAVAAMAAFAARGPGRALAGLLVAAALALAVYAAWPVRA